jgi:hypothetical protein
MDSLTVFLRVIDPVAMTGTFPENYRIVRKRSQPSDVEHKPDLARVKNQPAKPVHLEQVQNPVP